MTDDTNKREAMFSRSPIGGKKTSEIKLRCCDDLKLDLQRRAHELRMSESELSELFIAIGLYGISHVRMVQDQRLRMVGSMFPTTYPQEGMQ